MVKSLFLMQMLTSISADTDDQIDIKIAGADDFQFTANILLLNQEAT